MKFLALLLAAAVGSASAAALDLFERTNTCPPCPSCPSCPYCPSCPPPPPTPSGYVKYCADSASTKCQTIATPWDGYCKKLPSAFVNSLANFKPQTPQGSCRIYADSKCSVFLAGPGEYGKNMYNTAETGTAPKGYANSPEMGHSSSYVRCMHCPDCVY